MRGGEDHNVGSAPSAPGLRPLGRTEILVLVLLGLVLFQRLVHLGDEIDGPHTWRQADTAHYAVAFSRGEGDLFHPAVSWMGAHRTLILEFPVVEFVIAQSYRWLGEHLVVARLWFLAIFCSCLYLWFRVLRLWLDREIALLACLLFASSPLVVFFSRALIVDFAALGLGLAALWLFLHQTKRRAIKSWLAGTLCLTLGLLIKAPTVAGLLPLLFVGLAVERQLRARLWWLRGCMVLLPFVLFGVWQVYVHRVNGAAPDWSFLPGYRKFDDNWAWYFGPLIQRLELRHWATLFLRLRELGGFMQPSLAVVGIGVLVFGGVAPRFSRRAQTATLLLLTGSVLYLLVFFNLNVVHNYYQIPMVVSLSLVAALGLDRMARSLGRKWALILPVLLFVLVAEGVSYAERHYYQPLWEVISAGKIVEERTPEGALLISVWNEMDVRSPHLLYHSRRYGWSVPRSALDAVVLQRLIEEGADYLVLLVPVADVWEIGGEPGEPMGFGLYRLTPVVSQRIAVRRDRQFPWRGLPRSAAAGWYQLTLFAITPESA